MAKKNLSLKIRRKRGVVLNLMRASAREKEVGLIYALDFVPEKRKYTNKSTFCREVFFLAVKKNLPQKKHRKRGVGLNLMRTSAKEKEVGAFSAVDLTPFAERCIFWRLKKNLPLKIAVNAVWV